MVFKNERNRTEAKWGIECGSVDSDSFLFFLFRERKIRASLHVVRKELMEKEKIDTRGDK